MPSGLELYRQRRQRLIDKAEIEVNRLVLTTEDTGVMNFVGYFCIECWNLESELNSDDRCRDCTDGETIPTFEKAVRA